MPFGPTVSPPRARRPRVLAAAALALAAAAAPSCVARQDPPAAAGPGFCASCHGETGVAVKDFVPHLAGQNAAYLVNQLSHFRIPAETGAETGAQTGGARTNATMHHHAQRLSEADIEHIARFYSEQTCPPPDVVWTGEAPDNACTGCHGVDGRSADPAIPNLAGQKVPYMERQVLAFHASAAGTAHANAHSFRADARMGAVVETLPGDAMATVLYFNAQGCR
jgi:cytochrome c553